MEIILATIDKTDHKDAFRREGKKRRIIIRAGRRQAEKERDAFEVEPR